MTDSAHSGVEAEVPRAATGIHLKERIIAFAGCASIEVTPKIDGLRPALVGRLPAGTSVYVAHTPNASIADVTATACEIESWGFRAYPHLVARRIPDERALLKALATLRDNGVTRALLVAGDLSSPAGAFTSSLDLLATGALVRHGFSSLGVAGHPEGHKRIGSTMLWDALRQKQEYGEVTGTRMHIVSQFGFDPAAIEIWMRALGSHGVTLPVHIGLAGPATLRTLIKYAMLCGIGTSLNALMANLSALSSVRHLVTSADEMICHVIRAREAEHAKRIVKPHFFSFGGPIATADWLHAIGSGDFEVDEVANRVVIRQ